jgi:hypothetical protein
VIEDIRSYERATPPHLRPAVCDACAESISTRRTRPVDALAA